MSAIGRISNVASILNNPKTTKIARSELKKFRSGEFTFSFEFFHESENLGLSEVDVKWFGKLLQSFKLYSSYTKKHLIERQGPLACHKVPLNKKYNISAECFSNKDMFDSINEGQLNLLQMRIHDEHGRFFYIEYDCVIYILFIDPHHNAYICPGKTITKCWPMARNDSYGRLSLEIETFLNSYCEQSGCCHHQYLTSKISHITQEKNKKSRVFYISCELNDEMYQFSSFLAEENIRNEDIFYKGVEYYMDELNKKEAK